MTVPVILFAYNRPNHLGKTLDCLCDNGVPIVYAFSDGPRTAENAPDVAAVREMLHGVDWCEMVICERAENLGLGKSVRAGVSQVFERHSEAIVFEDDLVCVAGTYRYLSAALEYYACDTNVMSVTAWTHPRVTPSNVTDLPYFDGRAECWVWGTWKRAWEGIEEASAQQLRVECQRRGLDAFRYGADLPTMAEVELQHNIWAVRWLYWHLLHGGLCMRPPHSLVEHIGFDSLATNAANDGRWSNPPLQPCPRLPEPWPEPVEDPACAGLWQQEMGHRRPLRSQIWQGLRAVASLWPGRPR